jgi:hypothetical protein
MLAINHGDSILPRPSLNLSARFTASTILIAMSEAVDWKKQNARRGLAVYLTALFSGYFEWRILQTGESIGKTPWLIFGLMYMPAWHQS